MANPYYEAGEKRAEKVRALFARVAKRYDLMNDVQSFGLHRYWKRRLVQLAEAGMGSRALDVCCGTGDLALMMAHTGAKVVGLDFSEPMLEVAKRRRTDGTVQFMQGDAQALPFEDDSFDIVTIGYGLRNLANFEIGLREMRRVARPGGRLLVLDFGKPDNALWRGIYFGYMKMVIPLMGLMFAGTASAYAYILESLKHYPAQRGVAEKMRELGLSNVRVIEFLGGVMSINYAEKVSR
jgi:demethylmenaquinone methyltransferase/2-methoxy-6-polyprenyl-1,4-benzoquinol methylase